MQFRRLVLLAGVLYLAGVRAEANRQMPRLRLSPRV